MTAVQLGSVVMAARNALTTCAKAVSWEMVLSPLTAVCFAMVASADGPVTSEMGCSAFNNASALTSVSPSSFTSMSATPSSSSSTPGPTRASRSKPRINDFSWGSGSIASTRFSPRSTSRMAILPLSATIATYDDSESSAPGREASLLCNVLITAS